MALTDKQLKRREEIAQVRRVTRIVLTWLGQQEGGACVVRIAERGPRDADRKLIRETIKTLALTCRQEECEAALREACTIAVISEKYKDDARRSARAAVLPIDPTKKNPLQ